MSFWNRILGINDADDAANNAVCIENVNASHDSKSFAVIDAEVGLRDKKVHDIGAIRHDGSTFHKADRNALRDFLHDVDFLCGHNIVHHDARYLFGDDSSRWIFVDTLYMSPLLFPEHPYHRLLKDDKLQSEQFNNPVNDCQKALDLLNDELAKWKSLSQTRRLIYASLLRGRPEFNGFLDMVNADYATSGLASLIRSDYATDICQNADLDSIIAQSPVEMAYALAIIDTEKRNSITPAWVLHNYPNVENVIKLLRHNRCEKGCPYCNRKLDIFANLKSIFDYDGFRTYGGEPLQEQAVQAAVDGKSLLAIFPTGGGKSLTFQLPALMEGRTVHGLTVVISPLQSLMKDQVDNLADRGIDEAVTINGLLNPIERQLAIERVTNGEASLLYIAPEMLRSKTIERVLLSRQVVRFVIDEAHCFSSWGQDFRVDYLYIAKFIEQYQKKKQLSQPIPVSCFTATAKQKVVQDICDYFKRTLGLELQLYATTATRTNLRYSVIHVETDDEKYAKLRDLVDEDNSPTIVYVSRTRRAVELADRLKRDGYKALPYHGQMDADVKVNNQDSFMNGRTRIIVATSAFGMGVDKSDVGLVVHYDISDSLENYVQEAGRAGRDPHLNARCYVLYGDSDLDKHFILLNQTKLSIGEIQQIWRAVKSMTKQRERVCCSALEIARQAGWDDSVSDIETRVRTALSALEQAGYIERGNNVPHVYATGITINNMDEARSRIANSSLFENEEIEKTIRIIKSLISQKYIARAQDAEAESRIDYLADTLAMTRQEVVSAVERMRLEGILADSKDMSAYLQDAGDSERKSRSTLERFIKIESFVLEQLPDDTLRILCKQLNDNAVKSGITSSTEKDIRTLLYFLCVKGYIAKNEDAAHRLEIQRRNEKAVLLERFQKRVEISRFIVEKLYRMVSDKTDDPNEKNAVQFSVVELLKQFQEAHRDDIFGSSGNLSLNDIDEALLYLSKIGALKLEGGFLVLYNAMDIRRKKESKARYKFEDYRMLDEFYKQKIQQVHIVGEYANLMVRDYNAALRYVQDYFQMDYRKFVMKYFKGERLDQIQRNLSPQKYDQLFGQLSPLQMQIVNDKDSRCIVVAAGPGSGKTRVLVHKLASLLLLEDVKHEQLLMLTFSRAAATEFKQRLIGLIGNAAHFVEIKTFHAYCFDLLGRMGNLEDAGNVVADAAIMIEQGEVEPNRIGKAVLVIDEAQDMSADEYKLVRALMAVNEEMRVIAVGDDDQNIYEFRGSSSSHMKELAQMQGSRFIEMTENYRSARHIVDCSNRFVQRIYGRMKSTPIVSMSNDNGYVEVVNHKSRIMFDPLVETLKRNRTSGTTGVLTQTNEEAVTLVAILRNNGIRCQMIQSMDGIRIWNLAEIRYFLLQLGKHPHSATILSDVWNEAKNLTFATYRNSQCLPIVKSCIERFASTNNRLYLSDLREFLFESSIEDFCDFNEGDVIVSTIHKSKGREFDDVYMLVNDSTQKDDRTLRCIYVGMTRARHRLFIHTDSPLFNNLGADRLATDETIYAMPDEIVLQLSHKDVVLDYFKSRKKDILTLRCGAELTLRDLVLHDSASDKAVAKVSAKFAGVMADWTRKGYAVQSAKVRFIVSWKPKDAPADEPETAVLLPEITMRKSASL